MLLLLALLLSGCINQKVEKIDPDLQIPKPVPPKFAKLKNVLPKSWKKKVSISIGKSMSVKELINEICSEVKVNIDLSQVNDVTGISYSTNNLSFIKTLKSICRLCKWRLEVIGTADLKILPDEPYMYLHEVAFLSNLRRMKLLSNIQTISKNDSQDIGIALESENSLNLWNEIEENLLFILKQDKARYSINKQAGLILVTATQAEHERIAEFLSLVSKRTTSQVLIEAKIVEVVLNKKYKNGIDWDLVSSMRILSDDTVTNKFPAFESLAKGITILNNFGDTRTLSNPRAVVLNNQHAVFKVVKHNVYYKINSNSILIDKLKPHNDKHNYGTAVSSTANIVQTGIIFVVHASIDNGAVTLWIKPIISRSDKIAEDPAISILGGKTKDDSGMPIISEKSIDTVVRLRDGEVAMIGGLTEADANEGKVGFDNGRFMAHTNYGEKKEMVMVVKAKQLKDNIKDDIPLKDIGIKDIEE